MLSQVSALREGQEWLNQGARQRDDALAFPSHAALLRSLLGRQYQVFRKPSKVVNLQIDLRFISHDVLRELRL